MRSIQTNPPEHSTVAGDCAIDVHGWAEPGARLKINRQETPVAPDGLFLADVRTSAEGTITVEVENDKGRKTFERKFRLQNLEGDQ
ncbi:MAG: hypothetical protein ACOX1P_31315 [Thermoguttaceae bacterium]